jgi:hypothetical protein
MMKLGTLKKVDLRSFWKHEALDFTTWLAKEENLKLLSDEIGIDIELEETEASVGRFNVDILAKEEGSDRMVVIENQLEATDHDHLGKLITYAAGFDAQIIIWIVKEVRDEHKQAIDWLNEHTDEKVNLFIIKMELWQIDDSPPAPKFHVVSQPNDWVKALKSGRSTAGRETELKLLQLEFWTRFNEYLNQKGSSLRIRKPRPQHWYDLSIGSSKARLALTAISRDKLIGTELYIPDDKALFDKLFVQKESIERELGFPLEWQRLDNKKASRVIVYREGDIHDEMRWEEYFAWYKETAEKMQEVFGKYIQSS